MKKNKYVSPEMEVVEMAMQCVLLAGSDNDVLDDNKSKDPSDWDDF